MGPRNLARQGARAPRALSSPVEHGNLEAHHPALRGPLRGLQLLVRRGHEAVRALRRAARRRARGRRGARGARAARTRATPKRRPSLGKLAALRSDRDPRRRSRHVLQHLLRALTPAARPGSARRSALLLRLRAFAGCVPPHDPRLRADARPPARLRRGRDPQMRLDDIDLASPETFVGRRAPRDLRVPAPRGARLLPPRADGGPGFWALTRHDDVTYVSKHPELFSSCGRRHQHLRRARGGPRHHAHAHAQHGPAAAREVPAHRADRLHAEPREAPAAARARARRGARRHDGREGRVRLRRATSPPSCRSR